MKHIKLFESYFKSRLRNTLEEIQSEIGQYMYYILDDYQTDSSMDIIEVTKDKDIELIYKNIIVKKKEIEDFKKRVLKVSKIIEKEFNMKFVYYYQGRESVLYINSPKEDLSKFLPSLIKDSGTEHKMFSIKLKSI